MLRQHLPHLGPEKGRCWVLAPAGRTPAARQPWTHTSCLLAAGWEVRGYEMQRSSLGTPFSKVNPRISERSIWFVCFSLFFFFLTAEPQLVRSLLNQIYSCVFSLAHTAVLSSWIHSSHEAFALSPFPLLSHKSPFFWKSHSRYTPSTQGQPHLKRMNKLHKDLRNNSTISDNKTALETPLSQNTKVRPLEELFYAANENSTRTEMQHNSSNIHNSLVLLLTG